MYGPGMSGGGLAREVVDMELQNAIQAQILKSTFMQ
jgi:hypothetical protein